MTIRTLYLKSIEDFDNKFSNFIKEIDYKKQFSDDKDINIIIVDGDMYLPIDHAFHIGSVNTSGPFRDCLGRIVYNGGGPGGQSVTGKPSNYIQAVIVIGCESELNIESYKESCKEANVELIFIRKE